MAESSVTEDTLILKFWNSSTQTFDTYKRFEKDRGQVTNSETQQTFWDTENQGPPHSKDFKLPNKTLISI